MGGPYTHRIDPVLIDFGGIYVWWYGLGFALGFLQLHRLLLRDRQRLRLSRREVWSLTLFMTVGVLAGGRLLQVAFDEWPFYRTHLSLVPAFWLGGMATHGLLIGGAVAIALFARVRKKSILSLADTIVIGAAFLLGMGRIGNFIDGEIVGSVSDASWTIKFPYAEGFRHPVVLYDGVKNLVLAAYLTRVRHSNATPGGTAARFVFWYAAPRIFIDLFRDYPTHRLALGTGQTLNIGMTVLGLVLLYRSRLRRLGRLRSRMRLVSERAAEREPRPAQRLAFAGLLALCVTIPSNWTQDVPARYGARHPGLRYSWIYPHLGHAVGGHRSHPAPVARTESTSSAITRARTTGHRQ